jgi:hydroxymethylglutaryl-CoA reductase (NADPH)
LSFAPGTRDDFLGALHRRAPAFHDQLNVKYHVEGRDGDAVKKSGRWIGYAVRALIVRFWDLAKVTLSSIAGYLFSFPLRKRILSTSFLFCWVIS